MLLIYILLLLLLIAYIGRTLGTYIARMQFLISDGDDSYREVMKRRGKSPDEPSFWKLLFRIQV